MALLRNGEHLINIERHARTPRMPQHQHLRLLKRSNVHAGRLCPGDIFGKPRIVNARHEIIEIARYTLEQALVLLVRPAGDACRTGDILPEQPALERDDIDLRSAQEHDPVPNARPHGLVHEVLEVADVLLGKEHAAEVVGGPQEFEPCGARRRDVLCNGRIRMPREHRMGMNI